MIVFRIACNLKSMLSDCSIHVNICSVPFENLTSHCFNYAYLSHITTRTLIVVILSFFHPQPREQKYLSNSATDAILLYSFQRASCNHAWPKPKIDFQLQSRFLLNPLGFLQKNLPFGKIFF